MNWIIFSNQRTGCTTWLDMNVGGKKRRHKVFGRVLEWRKTVRRLGRNFESNVPNIKFWTIKYYRILKFRVRESWDRMSGLRCHWLFSHNSTPRSVWFLTESWILGRSVVAESRQIISTKTSGLNRSIVTKISFNSHGSVPKQKAWMLN